MCGLLFALDILGSLLVQINFLLQEKITTVTCCVSANTRKQSKLHAIKTLTDSLMAWSILASSLTSLPCSFFLSLISSSILSFFATSFSMIFSFFPFSSISSSISRSLWYNLNSCNSNCFSAYERQWIHCKILLICLTKVAALHSWSRVVHKLTNWFFSLWYFSASSFSNLASFLSAAIPLFLW